MDISAFRLPNPSNGYLANIVQDEMAVTIFANYISPDPETNDFAFEHTELSAGTSASLSLVPVDGLSTNPSFSNTFSMSTGSATRGLASRTLDGSLPLRLELNTAKTAVTIATTAIAELMMISLPLLLGDVISPYFKAVTQTLHETCIALFTFSIRESQEQSNPFSDNLSFLETFWFSLYATSNHRRFQLMDKR